MGGSSSRSRLIPVSNLTSNIYELLVDPLLRDKTVPLPRMRFLTSKITNLSSYFSLRKEIADQLSASDLQCIHASIVVKETRRNTSHQVLSQNENLIIALGRKFNKLLRSYGLGSDQYQVDPVHYDTIRRSFEKKLRSVHMMEELSLTIGERSEFSYTENQDGIIIAVLGSIGLDCVSLLGAYRIQVTLDIDIIGLDSKSLVTTFLS